MAPDAKGTLTPARAISPPYRPISLHTSSSRRLKQLTATIFSLTAFTGRLDFLLIPECSISNGDDPTQLLFLPRLVGVHTYHRTVLYRT